jgi:hypothetical protein
MSSALLIKIFDVELNFKEEEDAIQKSEEEVESDEERGAPDDPEDIGDQATQKVKWEAI